MNHFITYLKNPLNINFIGIKIQQNEIEPFLGQLEEILGESYEEYRSNLLKSTDGQFYIEVIDDIEYKDLSSRLGIDKFVNSLDHIFKVPFDDIKLMGLGRAQKNENVSYFVVVNSELLNEVRRKYDLDQKDFHITLGFRHKDVQGVRKNELFRIREPFLQRLKKEYYKEGETFEFVKGIKNFDLDFYKQIEPIKINDTTATFRCGENDYISISLVDNHFYITSKWQDANRVPILSDVLINKKFKEL